MRRTSRSNDQRLTLYLPVGAVAGRVLTFTDTGLSAYMEGEVPPDGRFPFTLHLSGNVVGGEIARVAQDGPVCRLQFTALTAADREKLAPYIEPEP